MAPSAYLAWTSRDMPQLGRFHDDGIYWVTAKSLAEGRGLRLESLPGAPAATKYPPMYPPGDLPKFLAAQGVLPPSKALAAPVAKVQ